MEIIIGMLAAFIAGAFVRRPFLYYRRKAKPIEAIKPTEEIDEKTKKKIDSWNNLLDYTGGNKE